jgi:tetratricopeptide (TPR) repeat protein
MKNIKMISKTRLTTPVSCLLTSHFSLLTLFLLLPLFLSAYDFSNGGVRNAAMGGAGTASTNDASAIVWNPAFLGEITWYQLISDSRTYSMQLDNDNLSDNFAYFSAPLGRLGSLGISAGVNGSDTYNETRLGVAFGTSALSRLLLGKENKLLIGFGFQNYRTGFNEPNNNYLDGSSLTFEESNSVFDADFGILYRANRFLQLGLSVNRLMSANMALEDGGSDKLPRIISAGACFNIDALKVTGDYTMEQGEDISESHFAIGSEYSVAENLFLRAGLNSYNITAGVGIDVYQKDWLEEIDNYVDGMADVTSLTIGIDYAFQTPFMDNEMEADYGNHYFGVRLSYGKKTVGEDQLSELFPDQYSSGLDLDSLYFARVKADTVFKEVTLYDTVRVVERVADEDVVNERVSQEAERIKLEQVGDINKASVYLIRALEFYYAEQYTLAIDQCEKAISIAPNLSMSYLRLASIYVHLSESQQALEYIQQGLRIDPGNEELLELRDAINN